MTQKHRILVTAHGHPDFSLGGGEIAAYNLFNAYAGRSDVDEAFFLARHDHGAPGSIYPRRQREYLWAQEVHDWFQLRAVHAASLHADFAELLEQTRPTVLHAHHYAHMGLEYLQVFKSVLPEAKIILTLHEFMAICNNNGQMVKAGSNRLCFEESFHDCVRCFPERSIEDFWLRKHRFQSYFNLVDIFVTPSDFLRERYINWGIHPDRIVMIENGQQNRLPLPARPITEGETRNRFGFFGQINSYKGVHILLKALAALPKSQRKKISLEVHGANLEGQSHEFRDMIAHLREPLERDGTLQWVGAYEPFQLPSRMAGVDWVIIPSVWWENSPMVIQEAFTLGRPVVCSDIGGMAEKVKHDVDGIHVPVGNVRAWGETLSSLANDATRWDRLRAGIRRPISFAECAQAHMSLLDTVPAVHPTHAQTVLAAAE